MQIEPFALERWFDKVEHDADVMLAESGVRSLPSSAFDTDPGTLGYVIPTNGDPDFRAQIGSRHGRRADETLFTCGTQEANLLGFLALMGTHAVVVTPTYGALTEIPRAFGEVTEVPLDPPTWELDPDAVLDAVRPDTTVVVINNPNNPTGRYHGESVIRTVYDGCADRDVYLLCDEVYRLLATDPHPPVASFGEYGLSTGGVSKAFGLAGLRFGWLVGSTEVVEPATKWKDYTTISPSIFGQYVAEQAIDREMELLEGNRELAEDHRRIVDEFLSKHGLPWYEPDCSVNGFPRIPARFSSGEAFCRQLFEEESVVLAPGDAFGRPDRFRIGYGLHRTDLLEGLDRLEAFLDRHG